MTATVDKAQHCRIELRCDRDELLAGLSVAASVVPTRSPRPTLTCARIEHIAGKVWIHATDLELSVKQRLTRVETEGEWSVLLPAARLLSIVRELGTQELSLVVEDDVATVAGGGSTFRIVAGIADDGFLAEANVAAIDGGVRIDAEHFASKVRQCLCATATNSVHAVLNGVLFETRPELLMLVATDGKRLALCEVPLQEPTTLALRVVVPAKAMQLMLRVVDGAERTLEIGFDATHMVARCGTLSITTQLIVGQYPPYEQVVPAETERVVKIDREALTRGLRQASLLVERNARPVSLKFTRGELTLATRTPDVGESEIRLPVDYDFDPLEIGFNAGYLLEALKVMVADSVDFNLGDSTQASLIADGDDFRYVVMPMELQ